MADDRHKTPGQTAEPIPRDMPDQQAAEGEDPWEAPVESTDAGERSDDVPDTDEAGTGRQGESRSDTAHPEHPEPEEPTG
ncbi:hypothetical protein ABZ078_17310 [Streptomyces sp. NPDC006385]|uniref:hypothetical protein n=1 Tax=Streptomyces sp. NPDC006385 TaxID=3156761 RepID=UPI0033AAB3F0